MRPMSSNSSGRALPARASLVALLLASLLVGGSAFARESSAGAAALAEAAPVTAQESVVRVGTPTAAVLAGSMLGTFGQGMLTTASTLTFALTDGVKSTVQGTASLAGTVSGLVSDTVKSTVSGTVNAAGAVGGVLSSTVKSTVAGTANVAGVVGSTVSGVAKSIVDAPQLMIQYATTMLGTPYKWGGNTIESGLDCSGFVREVVQASTGKLLPRTAKEMSGQGMQVAYTEMQPGDLVFFNTRRRPFSHVGIYLGDGRFMHGASGVKSGKQVRIDSFDSSYYRTRFNGARRLAEAERIVAGTELVSNAALPSMN